MNGALGDPAALLAICVALALGGILKGATGAGSPVVAVPVLAAFFDIRFAVVVMVIPGLLTNIWQLREFRRSHLPDRFAWRFAVSGGIGAAVGTVILASLPVAVLTLFMAAVIFAYVGLRLAKPGVRLSFPAARRWVYVAGSAGGLLQGAAGLSAPVAVTFMNAMRLDRPVFIATISAFFVAMSVVQVPMMLGLGLMDGQLALLGFLAMLPMAAAMPAGAWLGRRMSARVFDLVLLSFLFCVAVRLIWVQLV